MNKALVVDDEKLIVKGIKFSLEQDGYEVDVAYDGSEALKMAKDKWTAWKFVRLSESFPRCRLSC